MERVSVYDVENKRIEQLADKYGVYEADIIEALFYIFDESKIDIRQYL